MRARRDEFKRGKLTGGETTTMITGLGKGGCGFDADDDGFPPFA